jgi:hypothetical protein
VMTAPGRMFAGGPGGDPTGPLVTNPLIDPTTGGYYGAPGAPTQGPTYGSGTPIGTPATVPQPPATGGGDAASAGAAAPAGGSFDYSSLLGLLFDASQSGPFAGLGTYAGLGALGMYEANQARKSNAATIAPITQVGQPLVDAGGKLLTQAQSGTLTPAQQKVVDTSQTQGQTLIDAATPVGKIAAGLFQQYQSGNLKPADQAQLDAQVAQAKQQVLQALGPNADSTMRATYFAEIDNQALMTKNQMLNSYLATGNTEFDQWATTTQAGQQTILEGQKYAVTQVDKTFQQALEAMSLGGSDILAGIQLAVNSNTEISNALQSYFGNLAKAYALQKAGGAASRAGGGAGSPGSSVLNQAGNALKNWLTGGGGPDMGAISSASSGAMADLGTTTAATESGVSSAIEAGNTAWLGTDAGQAALGNVGVTGATDVLGTGAATTAATDLGVGTAGVGGGALGAPGVGAELAGGEFGIPAAAGGAAAGGEAGGAAAGAGLGVGAGAATALGIAALPIAAGLLTSPVTLTGKYWEGLSNSLFQGTSGNTTYDQNTPPDIQKYNAAQQIAEMIQTGQQLPPDLDAWAKENNMYDPAGAAETLKKLSDAAYQATVSRNTGGGGGGRKL